MNEMATLLRSILKEELEPIHKRLDAMEQRLDVMEQSLDTMELNLNELKVGQDLLLKNIINHIGTYKDKITENVDDKTSALNKRIFNVESVIERIIKQ